MEDEVSRRNVAKMSPSALIVRNIIAELLDKDPASISGESDFFLLGGNSLLLGRLAHLIRKETGFYEAVGYMISAQPNKPQQEKLIAKLMELPNNAVNTSPINRNVLR